MVNIFLMPNNLCFKLNLDCHLNIFSTVLECSTVVENLPRRECYRLEDIIIIACIPGQKEPKKHIKTYLKPLVDELLELWNGKYYGPLHFLVLYLYTVHLHVLRVIYPLHENCGFLSFSASKGCSK